MTETDRYPTLTTGRIGGLAEGRSANSIPPWSPTIGQTVHFYSDDPSYQFDGETGPYAAIVTALPRGATGFETMVALHVFSASGGHSLTGVFHQTQAEEKDEKSYWVWPK